MAIEYEHECVFDKGFLLPFVNDCGVSAFVQMISTDRRCAAFRLYHSDELRGSSPDAHVARLI